MLANVQYSYKKKSPNLALLSPLQDLGAHLNQSILRVAVRERRNGFNGLVDIVLGQGARLLETGAGEYDFTRLNKS